jgi:nucleotide-binding universal stress UspA family protein
LCGSRLTVLTVIKKEVERPRAETILDSARFVLELLLPPEQYQTLVRVGHPAEEIIAEAESHWYSMVVVGEKQHHGLMTRFVMGSTAQRVIEHSPSPVVLVKGQIGAVKRLLICDSGVTEAPLTYRVLDQLPKLLQRAEEITVLHVMSQMGAGPGIDGHQLRADANELMLEHAPEGELLGRDLEALQRAGYPCTPKVRHGLVVEEVLGEARSGDYDLVIIGAHRGTGWRRILLDDIAHQIVVGLDRPVLVVR